MTIKKPAIGRPCNGCGICCIAQVCGTGAFTMHLSDTYGDRVKGPCPAIVKNPDGTMECDMILEPRKYAWRVASSHKLRIAVKLLIGAGAGCDEAGEEENGKEKINRIANFYLKKHGQKKLQKAAQIWYGIGD